MDELVRKAIEGLPLIALLPLAAAVYQTRRLEKKEAELAEANRMALELAKELSSTRGALQALHERHVSASERPSRV